MTNKATKRALLTSVLALLLCVSMLVGTTYAWFTDSVTSTNNKIVAGNLKIDLELLGDNGWTSIKDNPQPLFDYENWEPGYTEVKVLQIKNEGSLALKWVAKFTSEKVLSKLADVIDVYVSTTATTYPADRDLTGYTKVGTLREFVNTIEETTKGTLEAGQSTTLAIALQMQETAGNEYQGLDLGGAFDIQIFATQYTFESDSFGPDYDENAAYSVWDGTVPAEKPDSLVVDTAKHLISINDAAAFAYLNTLNSDPDFVTNYGSKWKYSIELNADIDLANKEWNPITISNFVAFEGNGHVIKNLKVDTTAENAGLFASINCNDNGATYVRNFTVDGAFVRSAKRAGVIAGSAPQGMVQNVTVTNATVIGTKYVGGIFGGGNGAANDCVVKNSYILIPADGEKEAGGLIGYLANDGKASTDNKVISGNLVENVVISAPSVASGLVSQPNSANKGGALIVIENNALKNVTVTTSDDTADAFASNNVNGKSIVQNNTQKGCTINKAAPAVAIVDDANSLIEALEAKNDVFMIEDVKIDPAGMSNAYGKTGINVSGQTIDGNGNTLDIKGAGGTWDSGVCTSGGLIKDLTVTGSFRGIFIKKNSDPDKNSKVYLENVIIDGTTYTISVDSGTGKGLEATNSTFNGWTSYAATLGEVKFVNCSFGAGNGYNFSRPFAPTTYVGCDFAAGHRMDPRAAVTFENCTIGGQPLTAENLSTLVFTNIENASVK